MMAKSAPKLFINYRRTVDGKLTKSSSDANRLYDKLTQRFGEQQIFLDQQSIGEGVPFPAEIKRRLEQSKVLLVLIGEDWLLARGEHGRRRLDEENDWVRQEIETCLAPALKLTIIPILETPAQKMPPKVAFPASIAELSDFQASKLRLDTLDNDFEAFAKMLVDVHGFVRVEHAASQSGDLTNNTAPSISEGDDKDADKVDRSGTASKRELISSLIFALAYWFIAGLAPVAALHYDTGQDLHDRFFSTTVRVYSHLFLYPLTCGPIAAWVLATPLSELATSKTRRKKIFGICCLLFSGVVAFADYALGNAAIWEVKPSARDEEIVSHFLEPNSEEGIRSDYGRKIAEAVQNHQVSVTRSVYPFGLFMQMLALITIPWLLLDTLLDGERAHYGHRRNEIIRRLVLTLLISTLWLLCRIAFLSDKLILYHSVSLGALDLVNFGLFAMSYICAILLVQTLKGNERFVWTFFIGVAILAVCGQCYQRAVVWTSYLLGRNCQEINHLFCAMFLVLVVSVMPLAGDNSS